MKRKAFKIVFLLSLLGAVGAVLRIFYVNHCSDHNGYAPAGLPITSALVIVACLAAVFALAISMLLVLRYRPDGCDAELFVPADKTVAFFSHVVSTVLLLLFFLGNIKQYASFSGVGQFTIIFSLPAAVSLIFLSMRLARNKTGKADAVCFSVIAVFYCLCLLEHFIPNNINPHTLVYCFECVALGSTVLFCFARGGYALNKPQPFSVIFMGLIAVCFCLTGLAGSQTSVTDRYSLLAAFFLIFPNLSAFLRKLSRK